MIPTTTALASSLNPAVYGDSVTLTAVVTPASSGPAMTDDVVNFYDGNVLVGSIIVAWDAGSGTGQATLIVPAFTGGTHTLVAAYQGDSNYGPSSSTALTQTVNLAVPAFVLSSSDPASVYGQPVLLTAQVNTVYTLPVLPPSGLMSFLDGISVIGTAPVVQNADGTVQATLTVPAFAVGSHALSATYPGDPNYQSVSVPGLTQTVGQAVSLLTLTSVPNPAALCQTVTFTATVTAVAPGSGVPTGNVVFSGAVSATVALVNGVASCSANFSTAGNYSVTAAYGGDTNFLPSSSVNETVGPNAGWVLSAAPATADPQQGLFLPFGTGTISPLTGNFIRALNFDPNQHTDSGDDSCRAGVAPMSLVFNSGTVNVQPIILATLASDFCTTSLPGLTISASLTFGTASPQSFTFGTTGFSPGDVLALPMQVSPAISGSGIYNWSVTLTFTADSTPYTLTQSGALAVLDNTASLFGAGWALGGTQALLFPVSGSGIAAVAIVDYATGGSWLFEGTGPVFASPPNNQGTLVQNEDGTYTYTAKDQVQTNFDSSGRMISQVDPHGLAQTLTYTGSAAMPATLTQPDNGVTTFTYGNSGGLLSAVALPGGRNLALTVAGGNLTGFQDAAGGAFTFGYGSGPWSNFLTSETVGPVVAAYGFSAANSTYTSSTLGSGGSTLPLALTAAAAQGLGGSTALNVDAVVGTLTDGNSNTTAYTLDLLGRLLELLTADGSVQTWVRNAAGDPVSYTDQLGRVTLYAYNFWADLVQVTYPDNTAVYYQHELRFHKVTQELDALNRVQQRTYDPVTGDLLRATDATGATTVYTWLDGLMLTMLDALGRLTSKAWDLSTRRQTLLIDALGNATSFGYDSAGNRTSVMDALGRVTSFTYDGDRRLTSRTNALSRVGGGLPLALPAPLGVAARISALAGTVSWGYDAAGNCTSVTDELRRVTSSIFDQRNFLTSTTEAVGTTVQRTTTRTYDPAGNLGTLTDPRGLVNSFAYDQLNRQVQKIEAYGTALARTTTTAYDPVSNVIVTTDGRGTATHYVFDLRDRQILRIEAYGTALQRTTATTYDLVGNVLTTTNPRGTVTAFFYDVPDRIVSAGFAKLQLYGFWRAGVLFPEFLRILEKDSAVAKLERYGFRRGCDAFAE